MHQTTLSGILRLQEQYDVLKKKKLFLLTVLEESELSESVYNSNAIENSTLTLDETEKILLHQELPLSQRSQREVFEAINLARVTEYLNEKMQKKIPLTEDMILLVHKTLLSHIDDSIAGRFRQGDEYVRVGRHIAPSPDRVPYQMQSLLDAYHKETTHPLQRIITFHLEFEKIHPFCDGNGRVGRALINFQLKSHGFPPIIVQNKEKQQYYDSFEAYESAKSTKKLERIIAILLKESLHKRISYLRGNEIVKLSAIKKKYPKLSAQSVTSSAKKQSLPAFRERGHWKVGVEQFEEWIRQRKKL
jgi:Fic family protein